MPMKPREEWGISTGDFVFSGFIGILGLAIIGLWFLFTEVL